MEKRREKNQLKEQEENIKMRTKKLNRKSKKKQKIFKLKRLKGLAVTILFTLAQNLKAATNFNFFNYKQITINLVKDLELEISTEELTRVNIPNFKLGSLETMNPIIKQNSLCKYSYCPKEPGKYYYTDRIYFEDPQTKKITIDEIHSSFFYTDSTDKKKNELYLGIVKIGTENPVELQFEKKLEIVKMLEDLKPEEIYDGVCRYSYVSKNDKGVYVPFFFCYFAVPGPGGIGIPAYIIEGYDQTKKYKRIENFNTFEAKSNCELTMKKMDFKLQNQANIEHSLLFFPLLQPCAHYTNIACSTYQKILFVHLPYKDSNGKIQPAKGLLIELGKFFGENNKAVIAIGEYKHGIDYVYVIYREIDQKNVQKDNFRIFKSEPKVGLIKLDDFIEKPDTIKLINPMNLVNNQGGDVSICPISNSNFVIYYHSPIESSKNHDFYICEVERQENSNFFIDKAKNCKEVYALEQSGIYADPNKNQNGLVVSKIEETISRKLYTVYWRQMNPPKKDPQSVEDELLQRLIHKIEITGWEKRAAGSSDRPIGKFIEASFHKNFWKYYSFPGNHDFFNFIVSKTENFENTIHEERVMALYDKNEKYLGYKWPGLSTLTTKTETVDINFNSQQNVQLKLSTTDKFYDVKVADSEKKQNNAAMKVSKGYYIHVFKYDKAIKGNDLHYTLATATNKEQNKAIYFNYNSHLVEFDEDSVKILNDVKPGEGDLIPIGDYFLSNKKSKYIKIFRCQRYLREILKDEKKASTVDNVSGFKILLRCKEILSIDNVNEELIIRSASETKSSLLIALKTPKPNYTGDPILYVLRFDKLKQSYSIFKLNLDKDETYNQIELFEEKEVVSLQLLTEKTHKITIYRTQKEDFLDVSTMKPILSKPLVLEPENPALYEYKNTGIGYSIEDKIYTTFFAFYHYKESESKLRKKTADMTFGEISYMDDKDNEKLRITKFSESTTNNFRMIKPQVKKACLAGKWYYFIEDGGHPGSTNDFFGINLFDDSSLSISLSDLGYDKAHNLFCIPNFTVLQVSKTDNQLHKLLFLKHGTEKNFEDRLVGVAELPSVVIESNIRFSTSQDAVYLKYTFTENNEPKTRFVFINPLGTQLYLKFQKDVTTVKNNLNLKVGNGKGQGDQVSLSFEVEEQKKTINKTFIDENDVIEIKKRIEIKIDNNWIDIESKFKISGSFYEGQIQKGKAEEKKTQTGRILGAVKYGLQSLQASQLTSTSSPIELRERLHKETEIQLQTKDDSKMKSFSSVKATRKKIYTFNNYKSKTDFRIFDYSGKLIKEITIPLICDLMTIIDDLSFNAEIFQETEYPHILTKCMKGVHTIVIFFTTSSSNGDTVNGVYTSTKRHVIQVKGIAVKNKLSFAMLFKDRKLFVKKNNYQVKDGKVEIDNSLTMSNTKIDFDKILEKQSNYFEFENDYVKYDKVISFDLVHDKVFTKPAQKEPDNYRTKFYCVIIKKNTNDESQFERLAPEFYFSSPIQSSDNKVTLKDLEILHCSCDKFFTLDEKIFCGFVTVQHKVGYFVTNLRDNNYYYIAEDFYDFVYDSIRAKSGFIIAHCKSYTAPIENILVLQKLPEDKDTQTKYEVKQLLYGSIRGLNTTDFQLKRNDFDIWTDYEFKYNSANSKAIDSITSNSTSVVYLNGTKLTKFKIGKLSINLGGKNYAFVKDYKLFLSWIDQSTSWPFSEIFMPKPYATMVWIYIVSAIFLLLLPLILFWKFCYNGDEKKKQKEFENFKEGNLDVYVLGKKKEVEVPEKTTEPQIKNGSGTKNGDDFDKRKNGVSLGGIFKKKLNDIDVDKDHRYLEIME